MFFFSYRKLKECVSILALLCLFPGCKTPKTFLYHKEKKGYYYKIKPGDKLGDIVLRSGVNSSEIIAANRLKNPYALPVGTYIYLPLPNKTISTGKKPSARVTTSRASVASTTKQPKILFPIKNGKITRSFSKSKKNPYDGIGIEAALNTQVLASSSGKVLFSGDDGTMFGLLVIIEHPNSLITVYTHLNKSLVKNSQQVKMGQPIGLVGISGGLSKPLLHFQVRIGPKAVDPLGYLAQKKL